jgi:hypothetical protein
MLTPDIARELRARGHDVEAVAGDSSSAAAGKTVCIGGIWNCTSVP